MTKIRNKGEIIGKGGTPLDKKARALTLRSLEAAIDAVNPKKLVESKLFLKNSTLKIHGYSLDLRKVKEVYIIGGGKACGAMSEALENCLGSYITRGIVNVPQDVVHHLNIIELNPAGHPIPDKRGGRWNTSNVGDRRASWE